MPRFSASARGPLLAVALLACSCGRLGYGLDGLDGGAGELGDVASNHDADDDDADDADVVESLTEGLIMHLAFDEGAGATAADVTGNGHDGTLVGLLASDWVPGVSGTAINLEDPKHVVYAGDGCPEEPYAVSFWFNADVLDGALFSYFAGGTGQNEHKTIALSAGVMHVSALGEQRRGASIALFATGQWHHVAVNYLDFATTTVFVDGVDVTIDSPDFFNAGGYSIGRRVGGAFTPMPFDGRIDEVRVYDRLLSTEEVSLLATAP